MITKKEFLSYESLSNNVVRSGINCLQNYLNTAEYEQELEMLNDAGELLYKVELALRRKHISDLNL